MTYEIDNTFPRSNLSRYEELFPLPLACDEADSKDRPAHINTHFVFFLAEMSLRAILENILITPELENYSPLPGQFTSRSRFSPVTQELQSQLDTWILRLPANLDWSVEPTCGVQSGQGTRVKLLYWYARFAIHRPMMRRTLQDETLQSHFLLWEPFREGLLPALNLVKVFVTEQPDIDVIMANRYVKTQQAKSAHPPSPASLQRLIFFQLSQNYLCNRDVEEDSHQNTIPRFQWRERGGCFTKSYGFVVDKICHFFRVDAL